MVSIGFGFAFLSAISFGGVCLLGTLVGSIFTWKIVAGVLLNTFLGVGLEGSQREGREPFGTFFSSNGSAQA